MSRRITRRTFVETTAATTAGVAALGSGPRAAEAGQDGNDSTTWSFRSDWQADLDRVWTGAAYWANPLQDWRIAAGRLECVNAAPNRTVHLLTRQLGEQRGELTMRVRLGSLDGKPLSQSKGSAGFSLGVRGPLGDYRNSLIFGKGIDAGITAAGQLYIGDPQKRSAEIDLSENSLELHLRLAPVADMYRIELTAMRSGDGSELAKVAADNIHASQVVGNLALAVNFSAGNMPNRGGGRQAGGRQESFGTYWYSNWRLAGDKLQAHDEQAFGPVLFTQYTLHDRVLKMTAQLPPLGPDDRQEVELQVQEGTTWRSAAQAEIHPEARTATFRVENWAGDRDVPYRVVYRQLSRDGQADERDWRGVVRREPSDQPVLTVADISCNIHAAFPNSLCASNMARLNPDLLAFVGDQFYESTGGFGVQRAPLEKAILDYLRKWYIHGWTWRELMCDRPSVAIPDDHDVYQGNIWGEQGAPQESTQEAGGYNMPAAWVNVVHRTQASHHPDPFDPEPVRQGISVYYGPLTYGGVSFAILADRQFKTGPEGEVPPTGGRADHVKDSNFDPKTADLPGLELLGERQMKFLQHWITDWKQAEMKAIVSQTIFTAMATTHGGNRERLVADYDTNGWPQAQRNAALRLIRKAFAVHLAGDQHLPAIVHYGIDQHRDAGVAFAGPAINVGYPRWFEPRRPGQNREPGASENTGDFLDSFGNPMTVLAVVNGTTEQPRGTVLEQLQERTSGIGLVRFDKARRAITIECWPLLADPTQSGTQFPGWPRTISMLDNDGRPRAGQLPTLVAQGAKRPVVEIWAEGTGELVYALRMAEREFQPHVYELGAYTIRVHDGASGPVREWKSVQAAASNTERIDV